MPADNAFKSHLIERFAGMIELKSLFGEYGLQYDEPWDHLVEGFLEYFQHMVSTGEVPEFKILQIKEKRGSLRIITTSSDPRVEAAAYLLSCMTNVPMMPVAEGGFVAAEHLAPHQDLFGDVGVGVGWYPLLIALGDMCEQERATIRSAKEQSARLRCSPNLLHPRIQFAQEFAEYLSGCICEACGQPGRVVSVKGWLKTFCPKHSMHVAQ